MKRFVGLPQKQGTRQAAEPAGRRRTGAGCFPYGDGDLKSVAEGNRAAHTYAGVIPREAGSVLSMSASQDGTIRFVTARDHRVRWFDPSKAAGTCRRSSGMNLP